MSDICMRTFVRKSLALIPCTESRALQAYNIEYS